MLKVRMALAAVFIVVLACPTFADPPLWVVKSGKAEVFLFGQMWVKADTHWQSSKTWAAFNKSVELWTENPQERGNLDPSLLAEINRNSKPVSDLLSPNDMARLQAFLQTADVRISAVNSSNAYFLLEGVLEKQGSIPETFRSQSSRSGPRRSENQSTPNGGARRLHSDGEPLSPMQCRPGSSGKR